MAINISVPKTTQTIGAWVSNNHISTLVWFHSYAFDPIMLGLIFLINLDPCYQATTLFVIVKLFDAYDVWFLCLK